MMTEVDYTCLLWASDDEVWYMYVHWKGGGGLIRDLPATKFTYLPFPRG